MMHVSFVSDVVVNTADDIARNGQANPLISARLRKYERIDADHMPACINQRTSTIARIDGGIGLDVDRRSIRIELPGDGANDPQADRVIKPQGAAKSQYQLSLLQVARISKFQCGQTRGFDFKHCKIRITV